MKNNTLNVADFAAARDGAAFSGVRPPRMSLSVPGMSHVLMPNPAPAADRPDARLAAFRQIPALTKQTTVQPVMLPSANDTRNPNVYMTRVNAGGDGASGPHPEREPA